MKAIFFSIITLISIQCLASSTAENPYVVTTFECISIYYIVDSEEFGECQVSYRASGTQEWKEALPLWFDKRDSEYRGSIVGLEPNTKYQIRLTLANKNSELTAKTLGEQYKVGKITYLAHGTQMDSIHITESGSPDAYHLITPVENAHVTIDVKNHQAYTAVIDADYIIFRGIELKNAAIHGILVKNGRHHIIIEDCHITFWGRIGGPRSFGNEGANDSGIYAENGAGNLIIQRNLIETPRGCANDWDTGHPSGPQAITLINSTGNNIIRYNDLISSFDHSYNDVIGGGSNFSNAGSPNRDSDIYGNIIRGAHDDAIESEGANMNVRIWGNYTHETFQHIATASTSKGPLYIFRNIFGETRKSRKFLGGSMIKTGMRNEFGGGRKYIFHNTALQPNGPLNVFSGHPDPTCITRNNIFYCAGRLASSKSVGEPGDYDYDLFTGMENGNAKEAHGIREIPSFIESYYMEYYPTSTINKVKWGKISVIFGGVEKILTDPVITIPNPIIDSGKIIPNFNDDYSGKGPDLGAFEVGKPPLKFGRQANSNQWAPWELY